MFATRILRDIYSSPMNGGILMKSILSIVCSNHLFKRYLPPKRTLCIIPILTLIIASLSISQPISSKSKFSTYSTFPFVVLTEYSKTLDIGDSFYLVAVTSSGKLPTWKSSDSKVASVNTYGKVLAKKAGTTTITAKIKDAETSCRITVNKTLITLNETYITLEHNETFALQATTSTGTTPTFRSNRNSIASVDEYGKITANKPGEATITVKADGTSVFCKVKVKSPSVSLNKSSVILYRGQTFVLSAKVSSKIIPKWKTSKKSVALVDENGVITAVKHGFAIISATVDDVTKTCMVTVNSPSIELSSTSLILNVSQTCQLYATVSSGNTPVWSCSNDNVIEIKQDGTITALKKGTAYVYASEDGTKVKCKVKVTEIID